MSAFEQLHLDKITGQRLEKHLQSTVVVRVVAFSICTLQNFVSTIEAPFREGQTFPVERVL